MRCAASRFIRCLAGLALGLSAVLYAMHAPAQTLRVTAANSSAPNAVYDALFSVGGTTLLNSDGASSQSFHSLVFVPNAATQVVDLLVADTAGGQILRYFAPSGTPLAAATVVWSASSNVPGPRRPDGLSVDAAGNLYVVTTAPRPQIWVLQPSGAPGGYAAPILLDSSFGGHEVDALVETVIVPNTLPAAVQSALASNGINAGDLLALVSDTDNDPNDPNERGTVYDYSAASIRAFLANPGSTIAAPSIALLEAQLPRGILIAHPSGMDIWPADGSLLISTSLGTILQFALPGTASPSAFWTANTPTTFANIPCNGPFCPFFKLRTGQQNGTDYAFVTQSTGAISGNILEFAVPAGTATPDWGFGFTAPTTSVATSASTTSASTAGSPEGLAVAPATVVVTPSTSCISAAGCNPTGGLANVILPGSAGVGPQGVNGNIVEQTCIITDTRLRPDGTCPGRLSIAAQCPGFPANVIPPTICGAAGPNGNQFAIIETVANGVDDVPGILVQTQENPGAIIPGTPQTPNCLPQQVLGWAPRLDSNEGTIPEGAEIVDMTSYCDKNGGSTRGNSVWTVGGQLSPLVTWRTPDLIRYTDDKLLHIGETIHSANIPDRIKGQLDVCLITSAFFLDFWRFGEAAQTIYECDQLVAKHADSFGASADNPNPYGDIRGRLGSVYYTINSRILHNPPNTIWPLTSPPPRMP